MKAISKALIKVQQTVKNLEKNSRVGKGFNAYDGTKMFDVMQAFNSAMSDNGLSILTTDVQDDLRVERWEENGRMRQSVFCSVKTKYLLLHTSGESLELCGYGHGTDSQDKASGKALTYALKNTLINTFLTPVGKIEDTDSTHSDDIPVPTKKATPKPKKLPALPVQKYNDVAKFIRDGIGKDGVIVEPSERWKAIESKYSVSASAKKKINAISDNTITV
jgi:hypothetical protein